MQYKFAPNNNYEFLSAGSVIKSYKGNTNFPVRLGNEIFHRCLKYTHKKEQINIYDPMCGSGYLLTTLGIQNFNKLNTVYGSDINSNSLAIANKNLRLLTIAGINERRLELQNDLYEYNRPSYRKSLDYISTFEKIVWKDLNFQLFQRDIFKDDFKLELSIDLVILDLPYSKLVNYEGDYAHHKIERLISDFTEKDVVLAIVKNKEQQLKFTSIVCRREKIVVGKRIVEIYKKGNE